MRRTKLSTSTEATRWAQPISAQNVAFRVSELGTEAGLYGAAYAVILRSDEQAVNLKKE